MGEIFPVIQGAFDYSGVPEGCDFFSAEKADITPPLALLGAAMIVKPPLRGRIILSFHRAEA
ncbi:hypothetical protein HCU74_00680 [Spongiibacter sp. KMU-166]|uniref:Uncharacterized protein n=1 Tax=Spongiibacter thalassae TaxID=2721624 RepID=A0ABX1G9T1_9GAMM|nr:hypothetical protein [Spongiibacter thalassae]NKI15920.1 hypothetical protein [Spongiibacter thalassae]